MNALIVSRTKMGSRRCIGALLGNGTSLRLLNGNGANHPVNSPLEIGDIWNIEYTPAKKLVPPHVEDVLVSSQEFVETVDDMRSQILDRIDPWEGDIEELFGGSVQYTGSNNGYVNEEGTPDRSTGFWVPDEDLLLRDDGRHYDYAGIRGMKYVGEPMAQNAIPAGTLVRVSLARWWKPEDVEIEKRCYLQLSGWYD